MNISMHGESMYICFTLFKRRGEFSLFIGSWTLFFMAQIGGSSPEHWPTYDYNFSSICLSIQIHAIIDGLDGLDNLIGVYGY